MDKQTIFQYRINQLNEIACGNIDELLHKLNITYRKNGKLYFGICPIHEDADNPTAFNLYPESNPRGLWYCRTHHCEQKYKKTIIGLIRGVLSKETGLDAGFAKSLSWLCEFCGYKSIEDVPLPDQRVLINRRLDNSYKAFSIIPQSNESCWNRWMVRQKLEIPATYYIKRGYSENILDKFDVGLYNKKERIIVPVYDNDYKYVAGFTGRSIYEKCKKCGFYHNENKVCPTIPGREHYKWSHTPNFPIGNHLYNYWFAKDIIRRTGKVILVESPGNIWRLVENGVENCLGLFGSNLTDNQRLLLLTLSINYITILLDNDFAGKSGTQEIYKSLKRQYNIKIVEFDKYNDVGEYSNEEFKKEIIPLL